MNAHPRRHRRCPVPVAVLIALSAMFSSAALSQQQLGGNLEHADCSQTGDIHIAGNARVRDERSVACKPRDAEVRITELTVEEGAEFRIEPQAAALGVKADTHCPPGSVDCNTCANNVIDQFNKLFSRVPTGFGETLEDDIRREWHFRPTLVKGPSSRTINEAFGLDPLFHHVQGFVRTNHPLIQFAGTYSHEKKPGSIFFVSRTFDNDKLSLFALHDAVDKHPSGMATIGAYVIFGDHDGERKLRIMPVARADQPQTLSIGLAKNSSDETIGGMGGGVGMAKLDDGRYLLVMTMPGGATGKEPDTFFYLVTLGDAAKANPGNPLATPSPANPKQPDLMLKFIGQDHVAHGDFAPFRPQYVFAENLSVLTECGTGKIFVAHTNGLGHFGIRKKGYWRVSAIDISGENPTMTPVAVYETNQNQKNCYLKAAGTAWVNPQHRIELVCHEFRWSHLLDDNSLRFRTRRLE